MKSLTQYSKDYEVHKTSYSAFADYLDVAMTNGGSKELIGLSTGYPAAGLFTLPESIVDALACVDKAGQEKARPGYGWEVGSTPLRKTLIEYQNMLGQFGYDDSRICMVAGASYGMNRAVERIYYYTNSTPGDELLVIGPAYYKMMGQFDRLFRIGSLIGLPEDNFLPPASEVIAALTHKTRAIIVCNPTNPIFNYYSVDWFDKIIVDAKSRGIYVVIDEANDCFNGDDDASMPWRPPASFASDNVVRVLSASKRYFLAEYRMGYVLGSSAFIGNKSDGFVRHIGDDMGNAPLSMTEAWIEIANQEMTTLNNRDTAYGFHRRMVQKKIAAARDYVVDILKDIPCVENVYLPQSNYNLTFKIRTGLWQNDMGFVRELIDSAKVALCPGSAFGMPSTELYFRLSYAVPFSELTEGMSRIQEFLSCKT